MFIAYHNNVTGQAMLQVEDINVFYGDLHTLLKSDSVKDAYLGIKMSEQKRA